MAHEDIKVARERRAVLTLLNQVRHEAQALDQQWGQVAGGIGRMISLARWLQAVYPAFLLMLAAIGCWTTATVIFPRAGFGRWLVGLGLVAGAAAWIVFVRAATHINRVSHTIGSPGPWNLRLLRLLAPLSRLIGGQNSWCFRCGWSYAVVKPHRTPYASDQACQPLCEGCWHHLGGPPARMPYYQALFRLPGPWAHDVDAQDQIRGAVLAGR